MATSLVVLTEIPTPHQTSVLNALGADPRLSLRVLYMARRQRQRLWSVDTGDMAFEWRVLRGISAPRGTGYSPQYINPGVLSDLARNTPDAVVIAGYHHVTGLLALGWSRLSGTRALVWVESHALEQRTRHAGLAGTIERAKRAILGRADGTIVPGRLQADYVSTLGVPPEAIWIAPNAVDNSRFDGGIAERYLRSSPGRQVVLFVGYFRPEKGLMTLIDGVKRLDAHLPCELWLVGDGPLRERLTRRADELASNGGPPVRVLPYHPHGRELADVYAAADVVVLPSTRDAWGLVLNEAMAAGRAVVASDLVGAATSLIAPGRNGEVFRAGDPDALCEALRTSISNAEAFGRASRDRIRHFTPTRCAEGIAEAVLDLPNEAAPPRIGSDHVNAHRV